MNKDTRQLIEDARATYQEVVAGKDSRIVRGSVLWDLFEGAAEACKADSKLVERQLAERINELAVAKILAEDRGLKGPITYEPDMLPDGRKIDFVVDRIRDNAYIEVKTVHPDIADTDKAWDNYVKRKQLHPTNADFLTKKEWMGGRLYGNTFASRSRFLEYTMDFETRFAEEAIDTAAPASEDNSGSMAQHGRKRALDSSVEWPAQTRFYEAIYPRDAHCAIPGAVKLLARYGWRMDGSK